MTLTPSTVRTDLKCGKGAISKGEKCHKGPATQAKKPDNNTIRNVAVGLGTAAVIGGALYGARKFRKAQKVAAAPTDGQRSTPEQQIARGKSAFKELRGVSTGATIAGAGLSLAGAGILANEAKKDRKKRNAAIMGLGALSLYAGTSTIAGGLNTRRAFKEKEAEWEVQANDYKRQYYQAREQAQQRARQNQASGTQGSRNVGTNRAASEPFKDLGVTESMSDAEIKKRWIKLMRENHPDVGGNPRKAQQYNAAYQEIRRRRGKLDSIYADGFTIDWEAIAV